MRSFRHWTARYILNRCSWQLYQWRYPETPWIVPEATKLLSDLLRPTDIGLEWGAGRSTMWLAGKLRQLRSVESDRGWHERVSGFIQERGLRNVSCHFREFYPNAPEQSPYVRIVDEIENGSLDFVLVDGAGREHCALAVLEKLAPGAVLVVDNANWFLDHPSHSPASRNALGPLNKHWEDFERRVLGWRRIWTSQGVTDTAIWLRP